MYTSSLVIQTAYLKNTYGSPKTQKKFLHNNNNLLNEKRMYYTYIFRKRMSPTKSSRGILTLSG